MAASPEGKSEVKEEWKNPLDEIVWPDLSEWRTGKSGNRVYYINIKTKKSQWIKPDSIVAQQKALKLEQELIEKLAKEHPVWDAKRDRFGRFEFRHKMTNAKTLDKPYDFWTREEKQKKKEEDEKKRLEEEEKAKIAKIKESKVQPQNRARLAAIDALRESQEPPVSEWLKESRLVPLAGLVRSERVCLDFFKDKKLDEALARDYDSRRVIAPVLRDDVDIKGPEDPRYGPRMMYELFLVSLDWSNPKGVFPLHALRYTALYLIETLVFDNMYTIPTYPGDSKFNPEYYRRSIVGDDLERSGYSLRRVNAEGYIETSEKRQTELEAADQSRKPICSDELWVEWWSKKMKAKEEMYLAIKQRAFGAAE